MTPKQEERIRNKIARIRKELAADKKHWGGYHHDGKGLRYLPPEFFIKLKDYKGGLRYLRWFDRTFPNDCGHPIFLFEWTVILFMTGKNQEAEKKAIETFFSNTYLFDKFLRKEFLRFDKWEGSGWEQSSLTEYLNYSKTDAEFNDFVVWLESFLTSKKFYKIANELIKIDKQLKNEAVGPKRSKLVNRRYQLLDEIKK
ncbi:MAG: hypothetical protein K8R41_01975 [Bacteroidales bacterium]|nr:hypothetical protein [Bacteroidales bacterium]